MSVLMLRDNVIRALVKIEGGGGVEAECRKLYSLDQLMLMYDGIENKPYGHSLDTGYWYDQSDSGRIGKLVNCTWEGNGLVFDATQKSYVTDIGRMDFLTPFTIETVVSTHAIVSGGNNIVANSQSGGYELRINDSKYAFMVHSGGSYKRVSGYEVVLNQPTYICGKYDGNTICIYQDGTLVSSLDATGTIKNPDKNTVLMLGTNPSGSSPESGYYYTGKIFAVRIYNRALSDEEIADHYAKDYMRFMQ